MSEPTQPTGTDRYAIERRLGEQPAGRFAVAVDTVRGGRVTLFQPRLDGRSPARVLADLEADMVRGAGLVGTPYCTVRDAGIDAEGQVFVVVDRPRGAPLSSLLEAQGRLPIERALSIALQLSDLVHRAHQHDIFPVPVSPDSVIVDQTGGRDRVSLVDLALHRGALGRALNLPVRTQRFDAPQVGGEGPADPRDDVFAATALLFAMLFGVAPPAMSPHGPADGSGWPTLPEGGLDRRLEACLQTVLLRGLAPAREERFPRIGELRRSLTGLQQLMQLSAPAFELLAATRGRMGRGAQLLDLSMPSPGLERAQQARSRIRQVVTASGEHGARLTAMDGGLLH
ncbi:MAG: hypothetical protein H6704_24520 [Myxococcales bacterium]|nr:hypothetical protein [Myxococcales bacterium]